MSLELLTETGGNAFVTEEGASVLLSPIMNDEWLVAEYIPNNYPSWGVYSKKMTEMEAVDHVQKFYDGWYARKCNLPVNFDDNDCVIGRDELHAEIIERVYKHAENNDYTLNDDTLADAIQEAVSFLDYLVTDSDVSHIEDTIIMDSLE